MPGAKDNFSAKADYLTPFELNRTGVTAADADHTSINADDVININKSISAVDQNKIFCVLKNSDDPNGNGNDVTLKLYLRVGEGPLNTQWVVAEVLQNVPTNTIVKFNALYAGFYKIALEDYTSGTYDIYVSYSGVTWDTDLQHA